MIRLIDCNINRVCEGFRVLEDISRFNYDSVFLTKSLKKLRHLVRECDISDETLLTYRDTTGDIGLQVSETLNLNREKSLTSLICGNFKRIQEGLRTLEEVCKTHNSDIDYTLFENIRYESYNLEKLFVSTVSRQSFTLPHLYGITYHEKSLGRSNIEVVKEMIESGIKLIQYREKKLSLKAMFNECKVIRSLTTDAGVCFIINDHIDIAILVDADGVHIGQDDLNIRDVRTLLGDKKIIGLSTHSPEQALKAVNEGADYIGVGPIFETKTKVNVCDPVGYSYLEWVSQNIKIPFVAIGGIKEHNLKEILNRGAKSVALVSEITNNPNIPGKVNILNKIIKEKLNDI